MSACSCELAADNYARRWGRIHDDNEMEALKRATDLAGVTNAVLIGGFEDTLADGTKGPWQWTDGTDMDMAFMNRQRQGRIARQSETSPVDLAGRAPGSPVQPYDNYNQDEDQMAYCGPACCAAPGRELWGVACCTDTGPNPDVDWIHEDPNDLTSETIDYIFHDPEGSQPGSCRCCEMICFSKSRIHSAENLLLGRRRDARLGKARSGSGDRALCMPLRAGDRAQRRDPKLRPCPDASRAGKPADV